MSSVNVVNVDNIFGLWDSLWIVKDENFYPLAPVSLLDALNKIKESDITLKMVKNLYL